MRIELDPRSKIIVVGMFSFVILFSSDFLIQFFVLILMLAIGKFVGLKTGQVIWRFRKFGGILIILIIIQSIFTQGQSIIHVFGLSILTKEGLLLAMNYVFRVLVILLSGGIISTTPMRLVIQGLVQMRLPYEFALMTTVGIRFLPLLMEEMKNTAIAISLRGIDVSSLPLKLRLEMIAKLFVPLVVRSLNRAKHLAESLENRGFVIGGQRSSFYRLTMTKIDYGFICIMTLCSIMFIIMDYYGVLSLI